MQIGILEVAFLIILFVGVIIVSRIVSQLRAKRVCPNCGFVMHEYYRKCPSCKHEFPRSEMTN